MEIKKDWTPGQLRCWPSACPAILEMTDGSFRIIGKIDPDQTGAGDGEVAVTLPAEYLADLLKHKS